MLKLRDFQCKTCNHIFEYLSTNEADRPNTCPQCHDPLHLEPVISTPFVAKLHDPNTLKEVLKKRSADDTLKQIKKIAGHQGTLPKDFGRKPM